MKKNYKFSDFKKKKNVFSFEIDFIIPSWYPVSALFHTSQWNKIIDMSDSYFYVTYSALIELYT